ncbi:hypothetical protein GCM10027160_39810 [Streptomyces calidiresistens]
MSSSGSPGSPRENDRSGTSGTLPRPGAVGTARDRTITLTPALTCGDAGYRRVTRGSGGRPGAAGASRMGGAGDFLRFPRSFSGIAPRGSPGGRLPARRESVMRERHGLTGPVPSGCGAGTRSGPNRRPTAVGSECNPGALSRVGDRHRAPMTGWIANPTGE